MFQLKLNEGLSPGPDSHGDGILPALCPHRNEKCPTLNDSEKWGGNQSRVGTNPRH